MPSLARKSMKFMRDVYNLASNPDGQPPLPPHAQPHNFQPSHSLSNQFIQPYPSYHSPNYNAPAPYLSPFSGGQQVQFHGSWANPLLSDAPSSPQSGFNSIPTNTQYSGPSYGPPSPIPSPVTPHQYGYQTPSPENHQNPAHLHGRHPNALIQQSPVLSPNSEPSTSGYPAHSPTPSSATMHQHPPFPYHNSPPPIPNYSPVVQGSQTFQPLPPPLPPRPQASQYGIYSGNGPHPPPAAFMRPDTSHSQPGPGHSSPPSMAAYHEMPAEFVNINNAFSNTPGLNSIAVELPAAPLSLSHPQKYEGPTTNRESHSSVQLPVELPASPISITPPRLTVYPKQHDHYASGQSEVTSAPSSVSAPMIPLTEPASRNDETSTPNTDLSSPATGVSSLASESPHSHVQPQHGPSLYPPSKTASQSSSNHHPGSALQDTYDMQNVLAAVERLDVSCPHQPPFIPQRIVDPSPPPFSSAIPLPQNYSLGYGSPTSRALPPSDNT